MSSKLKPLALRLSDDTRYIDPAWQGYTNPHTLVKYYKESAVATATIRPYYGHPGMWDIVVKFSYPRGKFPALIYEFIGSLEEAKFKAEDIIDEECKKLEEK